MWKPKIIDLSIGILAVIAVGLLFLLIGGDNRMIARAGAPQEETVPSFETEATIVQPAAEVGLVITEDQTGLVRLAYQGVYTNPNMPDPPQEAGLQEGEGYQFADPDRIEMAGIGSQSTSSGSEFIPSAAFRHDGISPASGYRFFPLGGYIRNNSASVMCIAAPVYLPHGSTFTNFYMYFVDEDPSRNMYTATLWRRRMASPVGTAAEEVADLDFLASPPSPQINEIFIIRANSSFINTPGAQNISNFYSYYITYCFESSTGFNHRIYGFRVDYNLP